MTRKRKERKTRGTIEREKERAQVRFDSDSNTHF